MHDSHSTKAETTVLQLYDVSGNMLTTWIGSKSSIFRWTYACVQELLEHKQWQKQHPFVGQWSCLFYFTHCEQALGQMNVSCRGGRDDKTMWRDNDCNDSGRRTLSLWYMSSSVVSLLWVDQQRDICKKSKVITSRNVVQKFYSWMNNWI